MSDLAYLIITIVFFGLMLAYVRGCQALGDAHALPGEERDQ